MIVGGEKFMWVAYSATWGGMILYLLSLLRRRRKIEVEYDLFIRKVGSSGFENLNKGSAP